MSVVSMCSTRFVCFLLLSLLTTFSGGGWSLSHSFAQETEEADPAEISNGERLFLETRFAQLFTVFLKMIWRRCQ
jgi:hypothetical protein